MPKRPVLFGRVTAAGVDGDWQKNRKVHGGPDRAICIYSEELYAWLNEEGVRVGNGDVGENFTTRGLDLQKLSPGDRLHVGGDDGCTVEITKVRVPCFQLKKWDVDLPEMIVGRSGWMAKVVRDGLARPGDPIAWTPRETAGESSAAAGRRARQAYQGVMPTGTNVPSRASRRKADPTGSPSSGTTSGSRVAKSASV